MRRFLPVVILIVMVSLVAEVLPGSTPLTMPGLFLVDLLIYGPGALLIRELVRRRGRGCASILLLGAAYGLIEEGLALHSLFNPAYENVSHWGARLFGINWAYAEIAIIVHIIWSVAIPILLTELLFPDWRTTPYLHRFGLIVTTLWYLLGVAVVWLFSQIAFPYTVSLVLLSLVGVIVVVLIVVALGVLPRQKPRSKYSINAPNPWIIFLVIGIGAFVGQALNSLLWRIQPAFAQFPLVLVPMLGTLIVFAAIIWFVSSFANTREWSDRHLLALVSGTLIAHIIVGGLLFSKTIVQGVAITVMGLVMVILLVLFALHVRKRETKAVVSLAPTVVAPIKAGE